MGVQIFGDRRNRFENRNLPDDGPYQLLGLVIIIGVFYAIYTVSFGSMSDPGFTDPGYNRLKDVAGMIDCRNPLVKNEETNFYIRQSVAVYENAFGNQFSFPVTCFTWQSKSRNHSVRVQTYKVELLTDPDTITPTVEFMFSNRFFRIPPSEFNSQFLKPEEIVTSDGLTKAIIRMNASDLAKERE